MTFILVYDMREIEIEKERESLVNPPIDEAEYAIRHKAIDTK